MKRDLLEQRLRAGVFFMDGAMGTMLQEAVAGRALDHEGCHEWLNVAQPEVVRAVHAAFFAAGADAVSTNSFGAAPASLEPYGLAVRAKEINRAAARCARTAADAASTADQPRFVFGSMGPGTRLATLGQTTFDELVQGYTVQVEGLMEGGADGLLLETCQDLLQIKAGLYAIEDALGRGHGVPVYVSVTVEQTGALLIGSSIGAVVAALHPYPITVLGLNCATGPRAMRPHLEYLAAHWPGPIACMPNAGLPEMREGQVSYPLDPAEFAALLADLVRATGVKVAGGCCGSTPDHIRQLRAALEGFTPPPRTVQAPQQAASLFSPMDLTQLPRPLYVGERANATGSKKFRELLLAEDLEGAFQVLTDQEEQGAHLLDLSCAYAGRDETLDLRRLVARAARQCRLPLVIDSTQPDAVREALKQYGGRSLINSIHFEGGEEKAGVIAELARRFGAGLVGLTIDEEGMAMTADRKVAVARRLVAFCAQFGIGPESLLIDPLTFTVGSGDPSLRAAARETREALRRIKEELPGVRTLLGLSNVSFGLRPPARRVLNAVFLDQCLADGLDACIINVAALTPLNQIDAHERRAAVALLGDDQTEGDPLTHFINAFEEHPPDAQTAPEEDRAPETVLAEALIKGRLAAAEQAVTALLAAGLAAETILNDILVEAMKEVGRLFNQGILQLPFVLKSAEVMKRAVDLLKPHMRHEESARQRGVIVLATVSGDVHDIGKNLVDIILSNNGYRVVNLGVKVGVAAMSEAVRTHEADALGMSGLLVKSTTVMADNLRALEEQGIRVPVFLGGAALTPEFVERSCQPLYSGAVHYCADAFEGLTRMRERMEPATATAAAPPPRPAPRPARERKRETPVDLSAPPPEPPFRGYRWRTDVDLDEVFALLDETALIRGRWGYHQGALSREAYAALLRDDVRPRLERMQRDGRERGLFAPAIAWGWFDARGEGDTLWIEGPEGPVRLDFPRRTRPPRRAIPDFFRRDRDIAGFMVATMGSAYEEECVRLRHQGAYRDYLLFHGLVMAATEALAEWGHRLLRAELGVPDDPAWTKRDLLRGRYRGCRYGFGYAPCPDLHMNAIACRLVHAAGIGIALTESHMMTPEATVSTLIAHHPAASYFSL